MILSQEKDITVSGEASYPIGEGALGTHFNQIIIKDFIEEDDSTIKVIVSEVLPRYIRAKNDDGKSILKKLIKNKEKFTKNNYTYNDLINQEQDI